MILQFSSLNICPSEFLTGKGGELLLTAKGPLKFPTQVGRECKFVHGLNHCFTMKTIIWYMYLHNGKYFIFKDICIKRTCHLSTPIFNLPLEAFCNFHNEVKLPLMFFHVKLFFAAILLYSVVRVLTHNRF